MLSVGNSHVGVEVEVHFYDTRVTSMNCKRKHMICTFTSIKVGLQVNLKSAVLPHNRAVAETEVKDP